MSNQFCEIDRSQPITRPGNLEGWLDGNDWAHFIVEVVDGLDTSEIEAAYRGGWEGAVSAEDAAGAVVLLLCEGDVRQPADRAGHLRAHSGTSPGACIRITTASTAAGTGFCRTSSGCSCRSCGLPTNWGY